MMIGHEFTTPLIRLLVTILELKKGESSLHCDYRFSLVTCLGLSRHLVGVEYRGLVWLLSFLLAFTVLELAASYCSFYAVELDHGSYVHGSLVEFTMDGINRWCLLYE